MAGPNGSGKTMVTERGLAHAWFRGCEYINPDNLARDVHGDWNSSDAVLRAAELAQQRRALHGGHFIRLFFVATNDPASNAARMARRVMQGRHDAPIPKMVSRHCKSIAHSALVAPEVHRRYLYDNSVDGAAPRPILRASQGNIVGQYLPAPAWMEPIPVNLRSHASVP